MKLKNKLHKYQNIYNIMAIFRQNHKNYMKNEN